MSIVDFELTELERLCFDCPVPFGCNERDPRCLYRLEQGGDDRRERKYRVLVFLDESGGVLSRAVAEEFGWEMVRVSKLLDSLRRAGLVRRGGVGIWRLV